MLHVISFPNEGNAQGLIISLIFYNMTKFVYENKFFFITCLSVSKRYLMNVMLHKPWIETSHLSL
jgi:hypothetical protein